jgi:hypothetical protein
MILCPDCNKVLASRNGKSYIIHGDFRNCGRPYLKELCVHGELTILRGAANVSSIFCDDCKKFYNPTEKDWEQLLPNVKSPQKRSIPSWSPHNARRTPPPRTALDFQCTEEDSESDDDLFRMVIENDLDEDDLDEDDMAQ